MLEAEVTSACDAGELDRAVTMTIEGYGPEILGLILSLAGDEASGAEIFSSFCLRVWRGLPGFERRASLRTWLYRLARNETFGFLRAQSRRQKRQVHDSQVLAAVEQRVRTATIDYLRSQTKSRIRQLRDSLPVEDRALLILRVDRDLDWNDIVAVMHDGESLDDELRKREAARLRKRFQSIKERLREQAASEGLLERE